MERLYGNPAEAFSGELKPWRPCAPASDREAWEGLDAEIREFLVREGEKYLDYTFPQMLATDFMDFKRTGNRVRYEEKFFTRRRAFNALVLAECAENKGRFMDGIINGIYSICLEPAWQLPAHNSYIRDTPQLILPDVDHPVIELFSCETAAILATAYALLAEKLDAVSPFLCSLIRSSVEHRVITPYLTRHFWWMGKGDEPMNNWTVWCTQNVLLAAFLLPHDDAVRREIIRKAADSCDFFLKDYGDDGCCSEGAQYYRHAGLCLYLATEALDAVTGGAFDALWRNEKIRNIALYIANMHVEDKYYINFADCSPVAGRCGVREYFFGKHCGLPELTAFAAQDYARGETMLRTEENNLFYRVMEVFGRREVLAAASDAPLPKKNIYYPSVGIFILRSPDVTIAVKSGNNADSHNHNDTGSITMYKKGRPFLADIGVESYTQKTFSPQRYEIWTMQSRYHNLPDINGVMQMDGAEYGAKVLDYKLESEGGFFLQDIAGAYPEEAGVKSYLRRVDFSGSRVTLTDSWERGADVVQNFITYEKPEPAQDSPDGLSGGEDRLVLRIGELGTLTASCEGGKSGFTYRIEELPITDPRLQTCWKHSMYRIQIHYGRDVDKARVELG